MTLMHTVCLHQIELVSRTIVSEPEDNSWPKDFKLLIPFCRSCHAYPPFEEIKKKL